MDSSRTAGGRRRWSVLGVVLVCVAAGAGAGLYLQRSARTDAAQAPASLVSDDSVPPSGEAAAGDVSGPDTSTGAPGGGGPVAADEGGNEDRAAGPGIVMRRITVDESSTGFSMAMLFSGAFEHDILFRSPRALNVLVPAATLADGFAESHPVLRVTESAAGVTVRLGTNRDTDFRVRALDGDSMHVLEVRGEYRPADTPPLSRSQRQETHQGGTDGGRAREGGANGDSVSAAAQPAPAEGTRENEAAGGGDTAGARDTEEAQGDAEPDAAPVRTNREPSLAERDRNNSREAVRLAQRGQFQDAYDLLQGFLEDNPEAHRSRTTLGTLLMARQAYERAERLMREGLELAPNYAPYKKLRARLYMREERYTAALDMMTRVPPGVGEDPEYHDLLASLYQQSGQHEAAIDTYRALLRIDSGQPRWWSGLGISHEALGNLSRARSSYEEAVRLPEVPRALEQFSRNRIEALNRRL